jgi:hypothetical protein
MLPSSIAAQRSRRFPGGDRKSSSRTVASSMSSLRNATSAIAPPARRTVAIAKKSFDGFVGKAADHRGQYVLRIT